MRVIQIKQVLEIRAKLGVQASHEKTAPQSSYWINIDLRDFLFLEEEQEKRRINK